MRLSALVKVAVAGLLLWTAALPAAAQDKAYRQQIVHLKAADGHDFSAVMTTPVGGLNINAPALVHIHGGPGATPLDGSGPWIAQGLAAHGYTTVAPHARHGMDVLGFTFDAQNEDIQATVDFLASLGVKQIVMTGSSFGSISVTRYMIVVDDPRIKAQIHFAPTGDMNSFFRRALGDDGYNAKVREISELVSAGHADTVVKPAPGKGAEAIAGSGFPHDADVWLKMWGPASDGVNSVLFPRLKTPILMLAGDEDGITDEPRLAQLKAAATASPRVDTLFYKGGVSHSFYPVQDKVVADVAQWLSSLGLVARAAVDTDLMTLRNGAPTMVRGIHYTPVGAAKAGGPAFVLVNDWSADALRGATQPLGEYLGGAGYSAIAVQDQRGALYQPTNSFEKSRALIKDWIDNLGADGVVLVGHGYGAHRAADYAANSGDARVRGLVLLGPTPDNAPWLRAALGADRYAALVAEARRGQVAPDLTRYLQAEIDFPLAQAGMVTHERLVMYPDGFLRTYGPDAPAIGDQLAKVKVPVLVLAGARGASSEAEVARLGARAKGATVKWYGGPKAPDRDFSGYADMVADDVVAWTATLPARR